MKRFKVEQAQKSCKFADNCVDLSTHAVVGGGGQFKALYTRFLRG